jgi:glycerol uptake facilitator-like aquaporin
MLPRLSTPTGTATRLIHASIVLALSVSYFAYVLRLHDRTFLTSGLGDWIDPYFINYLLEHWHHSVWTLADPSSPPMYFPVRRTLSYSHGLILYAPFYVAVRSFLDPFQAYNVTLFLVMETGAVCLYLIFRKFLRLAFIESLLLSAFFFTSANVINGGTGVWSQRASVFLIPPILLMALVAARMPEAPSRLSLACLSGLLSTLLFTQDFYTGVLAALVSALFLAGALPVAATAMERNDPGQVSRRASPWWLIVACVSLVWAAAVLLHPIPRTTIGPLRFSATDPSRPLLIAIVACGWFVYRMLDLQSRLSIWWKKDRSYGLAFMLGAFIGCLVFFWIYLGAYREHHAFPEGDLINSLTAVDGSDQDWRRFVAYDSLRSFALVFVVAVLAWVPWFRIETKNRLYCLWFLCVSFVVFVIPSGSMSFRSGRSCSRPFQDCR